MSDNFIPLNQSTPVQERWKGRNQHSGFQNNWQQRHNKHRTHNHNQNRWGNNSQRSNSFGSDHNSSSSGHDNRNNIDAYLHPSMLQDPWAQLRKEQNDLE